MDIVKVELNAPKLPKEAIASQKEKQRLIDKIVSLKSENQQLALQLRNEQLEKASIKLELQKITKEMNTQSADMNILQSKLSKESAKYVKMNEENGTKISNLMHVNKVLEARNKQLQKGVNLQSAAAKNQHEGECVDDNLYEVDKLMDHKMEKGVCRYLVRWTGYSKKYDTWEKESDLRCPDILNAYKASLANKK